MGRRVIIAALAVFGFATGAAAETVYSVSDLITRIESAYAVQGAEAAAKSMEKRAEALGGLPDTRLSYEVMDAPDGAMISHKFSASQEFSLWGKNRVRREIGTSEAAASRAMLADRRLEVRRELREALAEFHYAESLVRIRRNELDALRDFAGVVTSKYRTGSATLTAVYRAETALAQAESMIVAMEAMALIAMHDAFDVADTGFEPGTILPFSLRISSDAVSASEARDLAAKALLRHPAYAVAVEEAERAKKEHRLSTLELRPDLMLELSYTLKPADPRPGSFSAGFSMNVPLLSAKAKRAEIGMAERRIKETEALRDGIRDTIYRDILRSFSRAEDYRRRIAIYEDRIRPLRAADLELLTASYTVDTAEFEMVLEALLMTYESEIENAENRRSIAMELLELEYLTGKNLITFEEGGSK